VRETADGVYMCVQLVTTRNCLRGMRRSCGCANHVIRALSLIAFSQSSTPLSQPNRMSTHAPTHTRTHAPRCAVADAGMRGCAVCSVPIVRAQIVRYFDGLRTVESSAAALVPASSAAASSAAAASAAAAAAKNTTGTGVNAVPSSPFAGSQKS
jgi:hypothetical protein